MVVWRGGGGERVGAVVVVVVVVVCVRGGVEVVWRVVRWVGVWTGGVEVVSRGVGVEVVVRGVVRVGGGGVAMLGSSKR